MGKPVEGNFLKFSKISDAASRIQGLAVTQLLHLYRQGQLKKGCPPLWGDEIEAALIAFDDPSTRVELLPEQTRILRKLRKATDCHSNGRGHAPLEDLNEGRQAGYTSEFAKYMVESEPSAPYNGTLTSLLKVEESMLERRVAIKRQLHLNEHVYTISMFPRLSTTSRSAKSQEAAQTDLISKEARYQAADKNINARRERDVDIRVPLFIDTNTLAAPERKETLPPYLDLESKQIRLESILFGPGHCGFQVTFQGEDEEEARYLHDQLIPLGPIMLALTASTPIYRGYLADTDVRWNQIANAIDDRPLRETQANGFKVPPPRRWSANETYISTSPRLHPSYQRDSLPINEQAKKELEAAGMDPILAHHYAHVLIRDPLIISEKDAENTDHSPDNHAHFESLEGTIWPHVRFKLPPHDDDGIGWRVEFRAMETQLTDFENAAFGIFMQLVRLVIKHYSPNMYIPIEKVQENMERAHPRDAVRQGRFWFRKGILTTEGSDSDNSGNDEAVLMSVDEVINGSSSFVGLLPLVERYVKETQFDAEEPGALEPYLAVIRGRANGSLKTAARWMRDFTRSHADYRGDSYVSDLICYDMMKEVEWMVAGKRTGGMFVEGQD